MLPATKIKCVKLQLMCESNNSLIVNKLNKKAQLTQWLHTTAVRV